MKQVSMRITIILFSITISLAANARKPAVEETFGVISSEYQVIPQGQEVAINFNHEIPVMGKLDKAQIPTSPWFAFLGFFALISLPALMWFQLTYNHSSLNKKEDKEDHNSQVIKDKESNIAKLEDYRKISDDDQDHKKAS